MPDSYQLTDWLDRIEHKHLHESYIRGGIPWCGRAGCGEPWPCETIRLVKAVRLVTDALAGRTKELVR